MKILGIVACLMLAGCETLAGVRTSLTGFGTPLAASYIGTGITQTDYVIVAKDMAGFLANQFPYAKTTIYLEPNKTEFNRSFVEQLAKRGFGVVEGNNLPGSIEVRYAVSVLEKGVVARMRFQDKEASRFYASTDRGLQLGGRYALRGEIK